jgi:trigger factor
MYSYKTKKLPKQTIEIELTIPASDVTRERTIALTRLAKQITVEGFRKGNVPEKIAEKHLKAEEIYQEMIRVVLPQIYEEIVKKEKITPIMSPKVELTAAKENEDWKIKLVVCEKPVIILGDYKKAIKEVKSKAKKTDIWVPGKAPSEDQKKSQEEVKSRLVNEALEALLKTAKIEIPDLIIEDELGHRLSRLVDDVQKIGLTTEQYLKSKNLTMEVLRSQFKREIEDTYKLEFLLSEVADKEGIKVEKEDIDKLFVNIKDEAEREKAKANSYYYATILRKQKTIDFLISV